MTTYTSRLAVVGSTLYFRASDGVNGYELWKSDGTEAGTAMVKDIHHDNYYGANISYLTAVGSTLYFSASDGVNDTEEDIHALASYLKGIPVHINIIPFNEYSGSNLRGSLEPRRKWFSDQLKEQGFDTTLRYSLGSDIAAACGQLVKHKLKETVK